MREESGWMTVVWGEGWLEFVGGEERDLRYWDT